MKASTIICRTVMWLSWAFCLVLAMLMSKYLTKNISGINSFGRPFEVFAAGMFFMPILICGAMRFWLAYIRNPWLALLPYTIGVLFALEATSHGLFLLPEFLIVFQVLSAALFFIYIPNLIVLRQPKQSSLAKESIEA